MTRVSMQEYQPRRLPVLAGQLVLLAALVGTWQALSSNSATRQMISTPAGAARQAKQWIADGTLLSQLGISLEAVLISLAIGIAAGVLLAASTYWFRTFAIGVGPLISWANAVPKLLFVSVSVTVFGLSTAPKILLATTTVMFVFYYYAQRGMAAITTSTQEALTLMGANRLWIVRHALVPSAALYLVAALRTAVPLAFACVIFAEIWIGINGVGALLARSADLGNASGAMAGLITCALVSFIFDLGLRRLEEQLGKWRQ
jgi:ABC-type nitrate/sulfonate/bicarbonate transport system permease component